MNVAYFDASALAKLVLDEPERRVAKEVWEGMDRVVSSRLAYVEVRSALAAAQRNRRLTPSEHTAMKRAWERLWLRVEPIDATADAVSEAGELAERYALRSYDAVHLATALLLGDDLSIMATWDNRLRTAAREIGFALVPA